MKEIAVGIKAVITKEVTEEMTALRVGSGSLKVLATPVMIALMEEAACKVLEPYLEEGITTVGTMISAEHKAPTPIGGNIKVTAVLTAAEGRKFCFDVTAEDEGGIIGEGRHERFSVKAIPFMQKAADRIQK